MIISQLDPSKHCTNHHPGWLGCVYRHPYGVGPDLLGENNNLRHPRHPLVLHYHQSDSTVCLRMVDSP
jgi:hypothetical protein